MNGTAVFFRDDDVGVMTERFRAVFDLLVAEAIPCNYQIVPSLLDEETAAFLRAARSDHPSLVVLNQHGYRHERRHGARSRWDEFGGHRPYPDQYGSIAAGRARLDALLGSALSGRVFTPPAHKYDAETLRALVELGFSVLSSSVHPQPLARIANAAGRALGRVDLFNRSISYHPAIVPGTSLREISVAIDVDEDENWLGRRRIKGTQDLVREFARARRVLPIVGVMLHHDTYANGRKIATLRDFLQRLKADPKVRFATIEDLADEQRTVCAA
jgi:hypothetical protein